MTRRLALRRDQEVARHAGKQAELGAELWIGGEGPLQALPQRPAVLLVEPEALRAIEDTGLTAMFGNWLIHLSGGTSFGSVIVGTVGSALGTNLINNVPMAVVMISALSGIQHAAQTRV